MSAVNTQANLIDPRDLLELLRQHPLTDPFKLAFYSENSGPDGLCQALRVACGIPGGQARCHDACLQDWQETVHRSLVSNTPLVSRCPNGRIGFVVPFPEQEGAPDCLIGGSHQERDHQLLPSTSHDHEAPRSAMIFEDGGPFTVASQEDTKAAAEEIFRILPRLMEQRLHAMSLARTTRRLEVVRAISRDLTNCTSTEQALAMTSEALVVLFDLPKILILLQSTKNTLTLHTTLGVDDGSCQVDEARLLDRLADTDGGPTLLTVSEIRICFPGLQADTVHLLPMIENQRRCGAVALVDVDLHSRDLALVELLIGRLTARLERLRLEEGHERERQYATRMVSMVSALSLINSRDELLKQILEMSAELIGAGNGSLMLLDETEGVLRIVAAKGMTDSLARSMTVPFGEGIAGKVAKNGFPMLVNDIERDARVANRNRPRFRTKSFISLPLHIMDRLIGVLNLADKADGTTFSETDLNLVQTFTGHAIQMIDRATTLEQADRYEKLSITDSLTGLYNRRFLEQRLQEEINRSQRQGQSFCIILADLDSFKMYNDICGHLAGDNALRKAAGLMRRTAREMDVVTRYGGEEFCLILPGTSKKESVFVGERIRRIIETEAFPGETHLPLGRLTISLGIAGFAEDGRTVEDLIHAADLALYQAKNQGRNRLVLYDSDLGQSTTMQKLPGNQH